MNDKSIQELVKMAMEIEALERGSDLGASTPEPLARIAGGRVVAQPGWGRRLMAGAGVGLAAAACLTIAFVAMRPPARPAERLVADATTSPLDEPALTPVVEEDKERCVVMTLYREPDGRCACVQMEEPEWNDGKRLAEVPRSELYDVAFRSPCSTSAQQALIVAVAGKSDTLPKDRAQAEVLAQQVSTAAASIGRHADVSALAYAAMPGLSPGSTVVAEKVAMRQAVRAPADWR